MEECSKKIVMKGFGMILRTECTNPVYKEGLCKKHFNKAIEKSKNWGSRKNYSPATIGDLKAERSLKLKNSNLNVLFRGHKGKIQIYQKKLNKYVDTDLEYSPNEFCVKVL